MASGGPSPLWRVVCTLAGGGLGLLLVGGLVALYLELSGAGTGEAVGCGMMAVTVLYPLGIVAGAVAGFLVGRRLDDRAFQRRGEGT